MTSANMHGSSRHVVPIGTIGQHVAAPIDSRTQARETPAGQVSPRA